MQSIIRNAFASVSILALAGCAGTVRPVLDGEAGSCYALFEQADQRARVAGVGDATLHRIPGFAYLRSNRFLASFAGEVDDEPRFQAWVAELRAEDQAARGEELLAAAGLREWDEPTRELSVQLDRCGAELVKKDLADPVRRSQLRKSAAVPSDYSAAQRTFGVYPLTALFLKLGVRGYQQEVADDYAAPLQRPERARLVLWQARDAQLPVGAGEAQAWLARAGEHPLGIPRLEAGEVRRLLVTHAPAWWIEEAGDADRPGTPYVANGLPSVDLARPQTFGLLEYTRFGGKVLPQLVYMLWFPERPGTDSYAGRLDGVVWRATIGTDGTPLAYDTIHPCGCYHMVFPARELRARPQDDFWLERVLLPQGRAPAPPLALRIGTGKHYVRRVVPLAEADADARADYTLAPYGELTFPAEADAPPRSLFDPDTGLVAGTERPERLWLWMSGVRSPGTMRAWGRHATAFIGQRHFDEPHLLDELFETPEQF